MNTLARKESSIDGRPIPLEVKERLDLVLNDAYAEELAKSEKIIDIYGFIFPEELLLSFTLLDIQGRCFLPVTFLLSCDLDNEQSDFEKLIPILLNTTGIFFDQAMNWNDDDNYQDGQDSPFLDLWTEEVFKEQKIFYKVTRENIALTLMADEILKTENTSWQ